MMKLRDIAISGLITITSACSQPTDYEKKLEQLGITDNAGFEKNEMSSTQELIEQMRMQTYRGVSNMVRECFEVTDEHFDTLLNALNASKNDRLLLMALQFARAELIRNTSLKPEEQDSLIISQTLTETVANQLIFQQLRLNVPEQDWPKIDELTKKFELSANECVKIADYSNNTFQF